jgi:hypothetical protein
MAAGGRKPERPVHVDADDMAARRQPHLSLAGDQHLPRLVLLQAHQGVLAVGAEPSAGAGFSSGTGQAIVTAGPAVFGHSTRLEMPAAEGPDNDMDASR